MQQIKIFAEPINNPGLLVSLGTFRIGGMENDIHPVDRLVGQKVRLLRLSRGLSQTSLASEIGVSFQQLQKYENGANRISASKLYLIAGALEVPVASFFEEAAEPPDAGQRYELDDGDIPTSADLKIVANLTRIRDPRLKGQLLNLIAALAQSSTSDRKGAKKNARDDLGAG